MKTKVISTREFSAIKKMVQIVNPIVSKKQTLLRKIAALTEEIEGPEGLNAQIASMEAGIKNRFLGLGTEQLIKKVIIPAVRKDGTPILDTKTGKQLTKTTYEPLECLVYNKDTNTYTLTVLEENDSAENNKENTYNITSERNYITNENGESIDSTETADYNPFNF